MTTKTLSPQSIQTINSYLHLPFPERQVSCPYYNNKHSKVRGGLRVLVGKGSVDDIVEEAKIISLKEKIDLEKLDNTELKHFLVDHNLGIDCSAFAYYVLDAELKAKGKGGIKNHLKFPDVKNPLRKLLIKLRTVENTQTKTMAHQKNSKEIKLTDILPGDLIIMLNSGESADRDHVLIVHKIDYENDAPKIIYYSHSLNWSIDGKYNHGVRQGTIEITDIDKPLSEGKWIEAGKESKENETLMRARRAGELLIKRLPTMSS